MNTPRKPSRPIRPTSFNEMFPPPSKAQRRLFPVSNQNDVQQEDNTIKTISSKDKKETNGHDSQILEADSTTNETQH